MAGSLHETLSQLTRANLIATRAIYLSPVLFNYDPHCLPIARAVYPRSTIRADDTPRCCWLKRSIVESRHSPRKWKEITYLNACRETDDRPSLSNELFSLNTPIKSEENLSLPSDGSFTAIVSRSLLISISLIFVPVLLTREMTTDQCPEYCSHGNWLPVLK